MSKDTLTQIRRGLWGAVAVVVGLIAAAVVALGVALIAAIACVAHFASQRCPACRQRFFKRVARIKTGVITDGKTKLTHRDYYLCFKCGAKRKRRGRGPWSDVTDAEWNDMAQQACPA
jgi:predicted RNA-binding protein YlxR (DUF448 family)